MSADLLRWSVSINLLFAGRSVSAISIYWPILKQHPLFSPSIRRLWSPNFPPTLTRLSQSLHMNEWMQLTPVKLISERFHICSSVSHVDNSRSITGFITLFIFTLALRSGLDKNSQLNWVLSVDVSPAVQTHTQNRNTPMLICTADLIRHKWVLPSLPHTHFPAGNLSTSFQ